MKAVGCVDSTFELASPQKRFIFEMCANSVVHIQNVKENCVLLTNFICIGKKCPELNGKGLCGTTGQQKCSWCHCALSQRVNTECNTDAKSRELALL